MFGGSDTYRPAFGGSEAYQPTYLDSCHDESTDEPFGCHTDYGYDSLLMDNHNDDEEMDPEEIESLLYSQIYFEHQERDPGTVETHPTTADIVVQEQEHDRTSLNSSFATLVNFCGRAVMSPAEPANLPITDDAKQEMQTKPRTRLQCRLELQTDKKDTKETIKRNNKNSKCIQDSGKKSENDVNEQKRVINLLKKVKTKVADKKKLKKKKKDISDEAKPIDTDADEAKPIDTDAGEAKHINTNAGVGKKTKRRRNKEVIMLMDSDFEVENPPALDEEKAAKKRNKEANNPDKGNKTNTRKLKHQKCAIIDTEPTKEPKLKKTKKKKKSKKKSNKVITIDDSDEVQSVGGDSDADLYMLDDSGVLADEGNQLTVHANGFRRGSSRDPLFENHDLSSISIDNWNGEPPLTIAQVWKILKAGKWDVHDEDKYDKRKELTSRRARYYGKGIQCRNCDGKGHIARDCSKPKKVPSCAYCGEPGHVCWKCPGALCYNCDLPGHKTGACDRKKKNYNVKCRRCFTPGHTQWECHELWRQFHMTTKTGNLLPSPRTQNQEVYCYNCGEEGHFGYQCEEEAPNRYWNPSPSLNMRYQLPKISDLINRNTSVSKKGSFSGHKNIHQIRGNTQTPHPSWKSKSVDKRSGKNIPTDKHENSYSDKKRKKHKKTGNSSAKASKDTDQSEKLSVKKNKKKKKKKNKLPFDAEVDDFPRNDKSHKPVDFRQSKKLKRPAAEIEELFCVSSIFDKPPNSDSMKKTRKNRKPKKKNKKAKQDKTVKKSRGGFTVTFNA